jgi:hypothetical protein
MPDPALLSNTIIGIQRETVRGTAPTTGVYAAVPFLDGISLSYESTPTEFDVYDGTRMKSFTVRGCTRLHGQAARLLPMLTQATTSRSLRRWN